VTDLDINYTITDNVTASFGANNLLDVYPDPTRELVDDVTTFSFIFLFRFFPVWLCGALCVWKSKCQFLEIGSRFNGLIYFKIQFLEGIDSGVCNVACTAIFFKLTRLLD
jgi:hypothetical protein